MEKIQLDNVDYEKLKSLDNFEIVEPNLYANVEYSKAFKIYYVTIIFKNNEEISNAFPAFYYGKEYALTELITYIKKERTNYERRIYEYD